MKLRWPLSLALAIAGAASAQPPTIQQPTEPGTFRVHPTTGAPIPLETIMSKVENGGYTYSCYLPGATSTVTFNAGEPLAFSARYFGTTLEEMRKRPFHVLEQLAVKKGRRYGTKVFIPFDITTSGDPVQGLDPDKKKNRAARTFVFTPRQALAPGEYAFSLSGLITPYAGFGADPTEAEAFRIIDAPRAAENARPAPPAPQAPAQSANSVTDARQRREAAERGDKEAQAALGIAYAMGNGVLQDYQLAITWLEKAVAQGSMEAQFALAVMLSEAMGVAQDDARAFRLFRQSAQQGYAAAQINLGNFYYRGRGVSPDYVEAHKWLNLGTTRSTGEDQKKGAQLRQEVAGLMTPEQVVEAQKRAREWLEAFERPR